MNSKHLLSSIVIAMLMIVTSFPMFASVGSPADQMEKASSSNNPYLPLVTITSPTSDSVYLTRGAAVSLGGTATDDIAVVNNMTWINDANGASGKPYLNGENWSISRINLVPGDNLIAVTGWDAMNYSSYAYITVTYDNVLPTVTIDAPTTSLLYSTNITTIDMDFTASDANGVASLTWKNMATGSTGNPTGPGVIAGIPLLQGINVIYVNATDNAGNMGGDRIIVTCDYFSPICAITVPTSSPTFSTSIASVLLQGWAADDIKVTSVAWTNSRGGSGTAYLDPQWGGQNVNWQTRGNVPLSMGDNLINVTAFDTVNHSVTASIMVTRTTGDLFSPIVMIADPTTDPTYTTTAYGIVLKGFAADDIKVLSVTWNNSRGGSGTAYCSPQWGQTVNWQTRGYIPLLLGDNRINVTVTDWAGNTANTSILVTVIIPDFFSPIVMIADPTTDPTYTTTAYGIVLKGFAADDVRVSNVTWTNSRGGSGNAYCSPQWGPSVNWQTRGYVPLLLGDNRINVTVTDWLGKKANTSILVTVIIPDFFSPIVMIADPTTDPTYTTSANGIVLKGFAADDVRVASVTWANSRGGSGNAYCNPQWGPTVNWQTRGYIPLLLGDNRINVTVTDWQGKTANTSILVTVIIPDFFSPIVMITYPTTDPTMTTGWHMIQLKGVAADDVRVATVTWSNSLGGSGTAYVVPQWGGTSVNWQSRGNIHLLPGDNVITVTVADWVGKTATATLTVTYTGL